MPGRTQQAAKTAFVSVLLHLFAKNGVAARFNRDSREEILEKAFRRIIKRAHPDKGGFNIDVRKEVASAAFLGGTQPISVAVKVVLGLQQA